MKKHSVINFGKEASKSERFLFSVFYKFYMILIKNQMIFFCGTMQALSKDHLENKQG